MTGRSEAVEELALLIHDAQAAGRDVPCTSDPALWTADKWGRTRIRAMTRACRRCPVKTACEDYVTRFPEPTGFYAGTTPRARNQQATNSKENQ